MTLAGAHPLFVSQCGEDQWLADHWLDVGLPDHGFFVDVGAADGVGASNTYWLEKHRGWRGLLCEPDMRHEITCRPNSIVERCVVGRAGVVRLPLTADPWLTGLLREEHSAANERMRVDGYGVIESVPLSVLLAKHHIERVDLVSIDTEGTELEVWQTLDLVRWHPRVAMIEHDTWGIGSNFDAVNSRLQSDGYRLAHATKYNCIFLDAA